MDSLEEMLRQLLEGQKQIIGRLDNMEGRLGRVEGRLDKMESHLDKMEGRLGNMEGRLDNLEGQVRENTSIIKVLQHRTEVLGAEHNTLLLKTVSTDVVQKIVDRLDQIEANMATKNDVAKIIETQTIHTEWLKSLSAKSVQHDAEINYLRLRTG